MPGLRRGEEDSLSTMGIPLVNVQQPLDPLFDAMHAPPAPLEQQDDDILGALAAPSSDDMSDAALALSRSMTANATRQQQELRDAPQLFFALPPPPPSPPASASWFTMLIYNIKHSSIYRIITQPSTVIVDLTSRHLHSLQEYSERQRFLSSGSGPLDGVLSMFASSSSSSSSTAGGGSLKKRKSLYHLTEEEDRLTRNPDRELAKAVELVPVSMDTVRPAKALPRDTDELDSATSDDQDSDYDHHDGDSGHHATLRATHEFESFGRSGESSQARRRRRRRVVGGLGQGALAYRNPFVDEPRTRRSVHHYHHQNYHHIYRDSAGCQSSDESHDDEDTLEWEGDDIASGYEARTNSVCLTEKGFDQPCLPTFALPGGASSLAKGMNPHYSHPDEPLSTSPPPPRPTLDRNSYSLHAQKSSSLPRPSSPTHLFDQGPILARLPKSKPFARSAETTAQPHQQQQQQQQQPYQQDEPSPVQQQQQQQQQQQVSFGRQHRGLATFSSNGWQRHSSSSSSESGSTWRSVPYKLPIPSEEDTLPAIHVHQHAPVADDAQTAVNNSNSNSNHSSPRLTSRPASNHSSSAHQDQYSAWRHGDDDHDDRVQAMEHDKVDGEPQANPQPNSTNNHSPRQQHDRIVAVRDSPSGIPAQQSSTWMRLDMAADLEASPPTSSVMTSRSLDDDHDEREEEDDDGNGDDEARHSDIMDTETDGGVGDEDTDHQHPRLYSDGL